jgi:uncharacterized protein YbaR (Trm112 family)
MIDAKLLAILACPVCKGALTDGGSKLSCAKCSRDYPVKDGIPDLVP